MKVAIRNGPSVDTVDATCKQSNLFSGIGSHTRVKAAVTSSLEVEMLLFHLGVGLLVVKIDAKGLPAGMATGIT